MLRKGADLHTRISRFSLAAVVVLASTSAYAVEPPPPAGAALCPCPGSAEWDGMAGGVVKGGHRFQVDLDAWNQNMFALTYMYGILPRLAIGAMASVQFLEDVKTIDTGLTLGIPILLSLLSNPAASARIGFTPGFFTDMNYASGRLTGFWLKLEGSYGFWLKKRTLMIGPSAMVQLSIGKPVDPTFAGGDTRLRLPFMLGAFGEYHVTDWVALAATLMAGAAYDRETTLNGGNFLFAYRAVLSVIFQTN